MNRSVFNSLLILAFVFMGHIANAQIWKNTEQKQSNNREATVKNRLLNNENALKATKDATLKELYKKRIALFKECQQDIEKWREKIQAGEKKNSNRYNLLTNLKIGKVDAMQSLINIRLAEIAYELFGGDFKDEPLGTLKKLRREYQAGVKAYDNAIAEITGNIN